MRRNPGILGWSAAALILVGGTALSVQAARYAAKPAAQVPGISDTELAGILTAMIDKQQAPAPATIAAAQRAIAIDPLSSTPYLLLGVSAVLQGDTSRGNALVATALRHNPRLRVAHLWQLTQAAREERVADATRATLRLLALTPNARERYLPVLSTLTRSAEARPLINAEIKRGVPWQRWYVEQLNADKVDPAYVYEVLGTAPDAATKANDRAAFLRQLIGQGDFDRAYLAWIGWLPDTALPGVAYLYDGDFQGRPGALPFNWEFVASGDGSASIEPGNGLAIYASGRSETTIARQTMVIPAGNYRLTVTYSLSGGRGESDSPFSWKLTCIPQDRVLAEVSLPRPKDERGRVATGFSVPESCKGQMLALTAGTTELPVSLNGHVQRVTIERLN